MRFLFLVLFYLINQSLNAQQCSDDNHSSNKNDSWSSCQMTYSPSELRGKTHWLLYDLGYVYNLSSTRVWNYNEAGHTDKGMRRILLDLSHDGINWTEAADFELEEASGNEFYNGQVGPDLSDYSARYVLISSNDTWGSHCAGLSELRFDVGGLSTNTYDLYADDSGISLYPNPTSGKFIVKGDLELFDVKVLDVNGATVQHFQGLNSLVTIDIGELPDGLYFISVHHKTNNQLNIQKIIKQSE